MMSLHLKHKSARFTTLDVQVLPGAAGKYRTIRLD